MKLSYMKWWPADAEFKKDKDDDVTYHVYGETEAEVCGICVATVCPKSLAPFYIVT